MVELEKKHYVEWGKGGWWVKSKGGKTDLGPYISQVQAERMAEELNINAEIAASLEINKRKPGRRNRGR